MSAPGKLGEGGCDEELKPSLDPCGFGPPGNGWQPAGTECCVTAGDGGREAYTGSQQAARLSFEIKSSRGSRRRSLSGRLHRSAAVARRRGPAGVRERGTLTRGLQETGRSCRLSPWMRERATRFAAQAYDGGAVPSVGANKSAQAVPGTRRRRRVPGRTAGSRSSS